MLLYCNTERDIEKIEDEFLTFCTEDIDVHTTTLSRLQGFEKKWETLRKKYSV